MNQVLDIGTPIIFTDRHGKDHHALCIHVWPNMGVDHEGGPRDGCNLVYVDRNGKDDPCGSKRRVETSVCHEDDQPAPGLSWRFPPVL